MVVVRAVVANLADELRRQWLPAGVARIDLVPELHLGFSEAPAQEDVAAGHLAREIDETQTRILELDSEIFELTLVSVDLARQRLHGALQRTRAFGWIICPQTRRHEVELEDRLAPAAMLLDDVLDDLTDEGKRAVGLFDGEQLHDREDTRVSGQEKIFRWSRALSGMVSITRFRFALGQTCAS